MADHISSGDVCIVPIEEPKLYQKTYLVKKRDHQPRTAVDVVEHTLMNIFDEFLERHEFWGMEHKEAADRLVGAS